MISQRENGTGDLIFRSYLVDSKVKDYKCVEIYKPNKPIERVYFHKTKGGTFDREMLIFLLLNPEE
jgi:hypothetical protein